MSGETAQVVDWWAVQDSNLRRLAGVNESSPGDEWEPAAEIPSTREGPQTLVGSAGLEPATSCL